MAFPLTASFIAELIILTNLSKVNIILTLLCIFPLFFSLLYTMWLMHNLLYGKSFLNQNIIILPKSDTYVLLGVLVLILYFGICPILFLADLELAIVMMLRSNFII